MLWLSGGAMHAPKPLTRTISGESMSLSVGIASADHLNSIRVNSTALPVAGSDIRHDVPQIRV